MSELIERVARRIHNIAVEDGRAGVPWNDRSRPAAPVREMRLAQARAAIEAMREPTEDMIEQGFIRPPQWDHDSATVLDVYQAMIDEVLKP